MITEPPRESQCQLCTCCCGDIIYLLIFNCMTPYVSEVITVGSISFRILKKRRANSGARIACLHMHPSTARDAGDLPMPTGSFRSLTLRVPETLARPGVNTNEQRREWGRHFSYGGADLSLHDNAAVSLSGL